MKFAIFGRPNQCSALLAASIPLEVLLVSLIMNISRQYPPGHNGFRDPHVSAGFSESPTFSRHRVNGVWAHFATPWIQRCIIWYDLAPKLPDGVSDWEYFYPIGIGHFDEDGHCPVDEHGRCPSGRYVQMRRLDHYDSYGRFYGVIVVDDEGGTRLEWKKTFCRSSRRVVNCNFFVMHGCLEYLRAWLDPSLPSRVAFMNSEPSLNLEGELYEIINSHLEIRGMQVSEWM